MASLKFANCLLILFCTIRAICANVGNNDGVLESGDIASIVQEMYREIGNLKQIVTNQGEVIAKLEHENELLKSSISKQEDSINDMRMKFGYDDIQSQVENDNTRTDHGEESRTDAAGNEPVELKSTDNKIRGVRAAGSSHVAFSAYLTHLQSHIGEKQIIKFDQVITNDGGGYNWHSGIFTAPVSGTYVFYAMVNSAETDVMFQLMTDDIIQAGGTARPSVFHHGRDAQATAFVILRLNQGVSVWVENVYADTITYSSNAERWTTFSGFLLY